MRVRYEEEVARMQVKEKDKYGCSWIGDGSFVERFRCLSLGELKKRKHLVSCFGVETAETVCKCIDLEVIHTSKYTSH
jgi:hypothetical protein